MIKLLLLAATEREAAPFRDHGLSVVVSGVGRVNAAVSTALALKRAEFDAALSVGIAGALPGSELNPGAVVVADRAIYAEEGMLAPDGFHDLASMGFPPAQFFQGNAVACDKGLVEGLAAGISGARIGAIATVATCSATDAGAREIMERTGALAEAMEGAAVVHAARLLGTPAGEVRAISNWTGDREKQGWDLNAALETLAEIARGLSAAGTAYRTD